MAFTQIKSINIANGAVTFAQTAAGAFTLLPTITNVQVADSSYNVLDDTAANTTGGFVVITGTNFGSNSQVIIGSNNATSTTVVNTTIIRAQVPASIAATFPVYVVDGSTGATAIRVNGLTYSSFPVWGTGSTLSQQTANTSFSVSLSANSDSNITYSNTTSLPEGTTLAANGLFSGTVSIGSTTTYSFDVRATDAENQDATRTFSLTVTVIPQTRLYAWGRGQGGALGLNSTSYFSSPALVGSATTWNQIDVGEGSTAATKTDGTLWTWGNGANGFFGNNTASGYKSSPTQVGTDTTWSLVSISYQRQAAALKTDGTLWTWGQNNSGELGLNFSGNVSSPTQVGANTNWSKIVTYSGSQGMAAIKTDGTLWTWGSGAFGGTGQNNTTTLMSPKQVGTETNWSLVKGGYYFAAAVKTDGTLWLWGYNSYGQLGLDDRVHRSSPVQVGSGTNWSQVNLSVNRHVIATKTDGTLWAWGSNPNGQLGLGDTVYRSSPVQVGSGTDWNMVSAGRRNSGAIKTNNTMWLWGDGTYGALAQNNTSSTQSPIQVTGTNWSFVEMGVGRYFAITSN